MTAEDLPAFRSLVEIRLLQAGIPYAAISAATPEQVWNWWEVWVWSTEKETEKQQREQERLLASMGR